MLRRVRLLSLLSGPVLPGTARVNATRALPSPGGEDLYTRWSLARFALPKGTLGIFRSSLHKEVRGVVPWPRQSPGFHISRINGPTWGINTTKDSLAGFGAIRTPRSRPVTADFST